MEQEIQNQVSLIIGKYGWLFIVGVMTLLFRSTIEKGVAGFMVFVGNDYNGPYSNALSNNTVKAGFYTKYYSKRISCYPQ